MGTATDPISFLGIAYHDLNNYGGTANANLDFTVTDPQFDAYVGSALYVGARVYGGANAQADGRLILGDNSHLHVGTTATPATMSIGYVAAGARPVYWMRHGVRPICI